MPCLAAQLNISYLDASIKGRERAGAVYLGLGAAHVHLAHGAALDAELGVLGQLVLPVVQVQPDLSQHPLKNICS